MASGRYAEVAERSIQRHCSANVSSATFIMSLHCPKVSRQMTRSHIKAKSIAHMQIPSAKCPAKFVAAPNQMVLAAEAPGAAYALAASCLPLLAVCSLACCLQMETERARQCTPRPPLAVSACMPGGRTI